MPRDVDPSFNLSVRCDKKESRLQAIDHSFIPSPWNYVIYVLALPTNSSDFREEAVCQTMFHSKRISIQSHKKFQITSDPVLENFSNSTDTVNSNTIG